MACVTHLFAAARHVAEVEGNRLNIGRLGGLARRPHFGWRPVHLHSLRYFVNLRSHIYLIDYKDLGQLTYLDHFNLTVQLEIKML
jgi:hypothetical protein